MNLDSMQLSSAGHTAGKVLQPAEECKLAPGHSFEGTTLQFAPGEIRLQIGQHQLHSASSNRHQNMTAREVGYV
jgi:hypothetical protein